MEKVLNQILVNDSFAICTDHLVERQSFHRILDIVSEMLDVAPVYTLAHQIGKILGPLEQRRIRSSFLTHKSQDYAAFLYRRMFFRAAAHSIALSCTHKNVLCFSRGAGHGMKFCKDARRFVYLYDWASLQEQLPPMPTRWQNWRERFFAPMLKSWSVASLARADIVWVSHPELKAELAKANIQAEVVLPPLELQEYPLLPTQHLPKDYVVINTRDLPLVLAEFLVNYLNQKNWRFVFIGPDPLWKNQLTTVPALLYWGERCAGELAPLLAGAKCLIDFSQELHPEKTLKALSSGTPVISGQIRSARMTGVTIWPEKGEDTTLFLNHFFLEKWDRDTLHQSVQMYRESHFRSRLLPLLRLWSRKDSFKPVINARRHDEALNDAAK